VFPLLEYKSWCDWSSHNVTCVLFCTKKQGLSFPPFPPLQCITQLILWTIHHQSCTGEQICTSKSFGQKYPNFRRYTFVHWYRIVGVWFTKWVVVYTAMGDMLCRTAKCDAGQPLLSADSAYGVATISRLLQIIGLFCKRAL